LKCIFGIMFVMQNPATNIEHHRAVPFNQHGKGLLIVRGTEALEEFAV